MKRILMLVGDFSEDYEVMVPFQALKAMGHDVTAVCPGKRKGELIATVVHDFGDFMSYTESFGHRFALNGDFHEERSRDHDGLLIPGGRAAEYLRLNPDVIELVERHWSRGAVTSAICHGVQLLTATTVLNGRRATAYPACKSEVLRSGATWVDTAADAICVDGTLITAPGWLAHPALLGTFNAALAERPVASGEACHA